SADAMRPSTFRAEFVCPQTGLCRISATLLMEGKSAAEGSTALQVDDTPGELADQGVDLANLTRLAQATGGKIVDPGRPDTGPNRDAEPRTVQQATTIDLWQNFTLLLLLCGLLGIDWFIRLFTGLAGG